MIKFNWNDDLVEEFKKLLEAGYPIKGEIEYRMGICQDLLRAKAKELGLNKRRNRGRTPGTEVKTYSPRTVEEQRAEWRLRKQRQKAHALQNRGSRK